MVSEYFKPIEKSDVAALFSLQDTIDQLAFNEQGLIPVVAQDVECHKVLMMAWMNKEALQNTWLKSNGSPRSSQLAVHRQALQYVQDQKLVEKSLPLRQPTKI